MAQTSPSFVLVYGLLKAFSVVPRGRHETGRRSLLGVHVISLATWAALHNSCTFFLACRLYSVWCKKESWHVSLCLCPRSRNRGLDLWGCCWWCPVPNRRRVFHRFSAATTAHRSGSNVHQHLVACEQISELEIGLPHCFSEVVIRVLEPVYQAAELGLSLRFLWQLGVSGYALLCRFEGRLRSSARVGRDSFCFFPFSWCLFR